MKRWISAQGNNDQIANGSVLGVSLDIDERVEWVYTILPDGRKIVTGYDILSILPQEPVDSTKFLKMQILEVPLFPVSVFLSSYPLKPALYQAFYPIIAVERHISAMQVHQAANQLPFDAYIYPPLPYNP